MKVVETGDSSLFHFRYIQDLIFFLIHNGEKG